jgi:hypothetical protein
VRFIRPVSLTRSNGVIKTPDDSRLGSASAFCAYRRPVTTAVLRATAISSDERTDIAEARSSEGSRRARG